MTVNLAKNTFYLTAASVGQKVLAFVYFLFLARVMHPENTGAYYLALSVTTIASVVTDLGITPVVIREVAKHPDAAKSELRRALGLKVPFIVLGVIAAFGISAFLGYDTTISSLVALATLVMSADALSLLFYGVLRGFQQLRFESMGIFVGQTFTLVIGGAVLILHPSLPSLVLALFFGSAFNALFSGFQVTRKLGMSCLVPAWDGRAIRVLLTAAIPFALAGIFVKIYSYIDSILLNYFIGTAAVGIYAVAYKMTYAFQFLPLAFVAALYPGMSSLVVTDRSKLHHVFRDAMWYMMILATPLAFGIWAVAGDAVHLAGADYDMAAPVLRALIFVIIPIFLDYPVGSLLNASNRQSTKTAVMGVTMIVNAALNLLLIPRLGIVGASYAGLIGFTFMFLGGLWFVPSIIPGFKFRELAALIAPIFLSGIVMAAVTVFSKPYLGFVLSVPLAAVAYIAMLVATRSLRWEHLSDARRLLGRQKPTPYAETPSVDA